MRRLVTSSAFLLSTLALSAQFALAAPPDISKGFDSTSILLNGTTVLRFFISTGSSQTGVAFTDNLPAGLVVASPNSLSNSCGGTLTATPGSTSLSLTGGTTTEFPPFVGKFGCNISVSVTGTTGGTKVNVTGNVSSTEGGMGNTATATLIVGSPSPSIFKSFGAAAIALNGSTSLSFTIGIGVGSQTGLAFTDTLPAGLVVATPNGLINTCNGTLTAVTGSNSISLTGGSIPGFTFACSIQVAVKGTTAGAKVNVTDNVSSTEGGIGNTATATLNVVAAPSISKSFGAVSVPVGGTTSLTFTINNPNPAGQLINLQFTDTLPTGLLVATPNGLVNTCGGTATETAGGTSVSLVNVTLAGNGTCTLTVNLLGSTSGVKNNVTSNVAAVDPGSTLGVSGNQATATLVVASPPSISKSFAAPVFPINTNTTLSFTLTNTNTIALTGANFTDALPTGLLVASPVVQSNTCGGTLTAVAAATSISLTGGTIPANGTCTITVSVTGTSAGVKNNVTSVIGSVEGGNGNTAAASTIVALSPSITKAFGATAIALNGSTSLTFTIDSSSGVQIGLAFTDTLPAGLVVATPNGLTNSCNGTVTAVAGSNSISLTGGNTTSFGGGIFNCTVRVNVTGTTAGVKNNVTGNVSSTEGGTGNTATASVNVVGPPSISKAFGALGVPVGGTTSLTFTINNPNPAGQLINLQFTDTLPTGLLVATPNGLSNTCGGTATATAGGTAVSLVNVTLAGNGTCTLTVNVLGSTTGVKNNVTSNVAAVDSGSTLGVSGNAATATLVVVTPPSISKSFALSVFPINTNTTLSFTLTNTNTIALTGANFTDALPAGLDDRSVDSYTIPASSILYFQRKITGSALTSAK